MGGGGSSKSQTVGYKYHLGMHKVLCHGPVDCLLEIKIDKRLAWGGRMISGRLNINKPALFGGESREGGVSGPVDFESGGASQGVNSYLASQLGSLVPAFRGVAAVVLRQVYVGMNPYLKKWSFRVKRVHVRQNGLKQWYDQKAEINGDAFTASPSSYSVIFPEVQLRDIAYAGGVWIACGENSTVKRSTDGGNTWHNVGSGTPSSCFDIVGGGDEKFLIAGGDFSGLKASADGGESFFAVSIPSISPGNVRANCVAHADDGIGEDGTWMAGFDYAGFGYVAVSQSGGTGGFTNVPYPGANYTMPSSPTSLVWLSGSTWLASTVSGEVFKSNSIGFTWFSTGKFNVRFLKKLPQGVFGFTAETGEFNSGSVVRTLDGGVTWRTSLPLPFAPSGITNFGDLLVVVGAGGRVALSYDLGVSWETLPQILGGGAHLSSITSNGEDTAFAVGANGVLVRLSIIRARKGDMNPAHIIRECLTDPDWGMGYAEAEVDEASFVKAADTLFTEQFGISILWDRQIPVEDFIKEILKHIDGTLFVDRKTGLFTLKLIRGDYTEEGLLHLNEENIERVDNFTRTTLGELTNSVSINYWNAETGNDASVTVQDIALIQMQQATINTTLQYPGLTNSNLASRVCQRSLKTLSTPRVSCTIYTTRVAKDLNIGDVFLFSWPDYEINNMVMRVADMAYGDGKSHRLRITCTQDTFDMPSTAYVTPTDPIWVDPIQEPVPATRQLAFEVPYRELIQALGQASTDSLLASGPETGFAGMAVGRPEGSAINARMYVDDSSGYNDVAGIDFCPVGDLTSSVGVEDTVFPLSNWTDAGLVETSTWAQIGDELVLVTSIGESSVTVKRGILDTVPSKHEAGSSVFFWDAFSAGDVTEYVSGETLDIKVTPVSGNGQVDLADSLTSSLEIVGRAARPYRPANLKVNDLYAVPEVTYPASVTWAHRSRQHDTAGEPLGYYEGSMMPEEGVTYTVRVVELSASLEEGTVLATVEGLTGESWVMESTVTSGSVAPAILLGVRAVKNGLESYRESRIILPGLLLAPTNLVASVEVY